VSWALSMLIDATLATIQVRHFLGVRVDVRTVAYALLVPVVTVGIPAVGLRLAFGPTLTGLFLAVPVCLALFLGWCALDRTRLHLRALNLLARR